ncbi:MAG: acyl-CoA desaturase, partial [Flavobacteriales bacterium]|nr:acyl-CoA desaturase [Flavobacteriales bacterium]
MKAIRFNSRSNPEFVKELRKRVNGYFKENKISRYGNWNMKVKTIFMMSLYFAPYCVMLFGGVTNIWLFLGLWIVMGLGVSGIGLAVMHDANHGAYSKNPKINKIVGYALNMVGGNAANWRMQHNVLHHTFTNIDGMDEDIAPGKMMRFSPHQERLKIHRFQHIYAWFFYSLMTVSWMTQKDFTQLIRFKNTGLIDSQKASFKALMIELIISKLIYFGYLLVIPMIFAPVAWYWVLLGFILLLFVSGFVLACIFQPAHVIPSSDYPLPDNTGNMDNDWAIHQLATTANFAPKSRIFSWFVGGLNFQIEHHLFPNICHVHY